MTDQQSFLWLVKEYGLPFAMSVLFIVGLIRKWWVLGWTYDEKVVENQEWKSAHLEQLRQTHKALDMAAAKERR